MSVLYVVFAPITIALLLIFIVEQIVKLFKESKPVGKKKPMTIDEARDRLWKGYTNAYFDFD